MGASSHQEDTGSKHTDHFESSDLVLGRRCTPPLYPPTHPKTFFTP